MESDTFYEPSLNFKVTKPSNWKFMPPAWSPVTQMKNALEKNEEHWSQYANQPFCVAMQHHASQRSVYPTFQVTVRYMPKPNNERANQLLATQLSFCENNFQEFKTIESTSKAIVSGFRANKIRASYILPFESSGEVINASVHTLLYTVFSNQMAFTIGLSGPGEKEFSCENDLREIVQSIRIGA